MKAVDGISWFSRLYIRFGMAVLASKWMKTAVFKSILKDVIFLGFKVQHWVLDDNFNLTIDV